MNGKTIRIAIDPSKPITELLYPEFYDVKVTSHCKGQCPYCFVGDTRINTLNGEKPIEDILISDVVVNYDVFEQKNSIGKVEQLHKRLYEGEVIVIELENGKIIKCTPNHKFYVNGKWIEAKNLKDTDNLLDI